MTFVAVVWVFFFFFFFFFLFSAPPPKPRKKTKKKKKKQKQNKKKKKKKHTTATNVIQNKQLVLSHHETKDSSLLSSNQPNQHLTNPAHGKTNRGLTDGVKGKKAGPNLGTKSNDSTNYSRPIHNSLIVETPGDKQTNTVILSSEHADSSNHLELS